MRAHLTEDHPEIDQSSTAEDLVKLFRFKVLRRHASSMVRQLHEAVTIRRAEGEILNRH